MHREEFEKLACMHRLVKTIALVSGSFLKTNVMDAHNASIGVENRGARAAALGITPVRKCLSKIDSRRC